MDWLLHPCIVLAPPFRPDGVDRGYGKLLKVPQPSLGTNLLSEKLRIFNTYIISSSNYDGSKSNMNETSHMIMVINKNIFLKNAQTLPSAPKLGIIFYF